MLSHQAIYTYKRSRRGLTLVEMMVSVALTLMVVFALVRVFEALGGNVTTGRATIEMSANLRSAAQLLRSDLAGLTVTTLPPRTPEQGEGYLEIVDGPGTDSQYVYMDANGVGQWASWNGREDIRDMDPVSDGYLDTVYDTSVGDTDDILAFTSRNMESPFRGTISDPRIKFRRSSNTTYVTNPLAPTRILDSTEAEIIWWLQAERLANDPSLLYSMDQPSQLTAAITGQIQIYPNQTTPVRSLHRRVLLIQPDLDLSEVVLNSAEELAIFLSNNDLSVRVIRDGATFRVVANSLSDLTTRKNRACRTPQPLDSDRLPLTYIGAPVTGGLGSIRTGGMLNPTSTLLLHGAMKDMVLNYTGNPFSMLRRGNDVVVSDVLAFDVRVWDPAALTRVTEDGTVITPSDPGYNIVPVADSVGMAGAYVDLGFGVMPKSGTSNYPVTLQGQFGSVPHARSQLIRPLSNNVDSGEATYCTWSGRYEHDGLDQDGDGIVDQGTDGLDNNNQFGVDDPSELETLPPYPRPVRGVNITLRIMDSETRQVRQTSVVSDFLPE